MNMRLRLASEAGAVFPGSRGLVFGPSADFEPDAVRLSCEIVEDRMPAAGLWQNAGISTHMSAPADVHFDFALVCLPRSKDEARARIAAACRIAPRVFVDGQKTDGVEGVLRDVRARIAVAGTISKSHGKLFWFDGGDFDDWKTGPRQIDGRWHVMPGVFSADSVDAGSAALAAALPRLSGQVADLGAGWGYLAASVLDTSDEVTDLHLVEAHATALDCARRNVPDPRARFHWADALTWEAPARLDVVMMNPPFHSARAADPDLGRAFIRSAARLLRPGGTLWMVANRHLPYETALRESFADIAQHGENPAFKIFEARKGR